VSEEQVDAGERLAQRVGGCAAGPLQGVVLAGHQRHPVWQRARGRPPRAEHVGVHDLLAAEGCGQPIRERAPASVLQRRTAAEQLDLYAARTKQREPFARRVAREPARLDALSTERVREPQRAELRTARLEHRDHARHSHRHIR